MATVSRRNLVKDPRFAVLPTVWETGTPSFSTTHVRPDRTKAVKVDFPTDATSYPTVWGTDVFTITSGQTLHIGAWVYEDDDAGQVVIVRDAPYQEWTHHTVRGWNWITRSFTGTMTSELYFGVRYYGGYSLWFSDPIAEIRTTVLSSSDYFDALFPTETRVEDNATRSYGWEGTANNSPSLQYDWELPADVPTTLADPTVVQTSCSGDDQVAPTLTRPANTSSVVYTQTGNVVAGGSTTVTATAQAGYILPASRVGWTIAGNRKTATWVISWANPSCTVTTTLTDPTIAQTSCFGGSQIAPTLTRPTNTSSVVYTQSGNVVAGGTTTITATAQTGYILPASQTDWIIAGNRKTATWVVFWANPNCTVPDATVYPEDPLVLQPYCVGSTLIPPSISRPVNTASIVYTQSGSVLPGGSTTVTATAQSGYVFPSSVPGWTATGSNKVLNFVVYWYNPNCEVLGEMIVWNRPEDQIFEIGIDRGVLYVGSLAVPWNGLTDVTIKQEGGDIKSFYMDGVKRQTRVIPTDFAADINAFTAPALFRSCDGFNEINTGFVVDNAPRKPFGLAYRSLVGNGIKGKNFAYKIHLIYNAFASSGDKVNTSISDSSDPETYSWTLTATPDRSIDGNYGAHYILDSREVPLAKLSQIETILYGTVSIAPRLPLPSEIDTIIG